MTSFFLWFWNSRKNESLGIATCSRFHNCHVPGWTRFVGILCYLLAAKEVGVKETSLLERLVVILFYLIVFHNHLSWRKINYYVSSNLYLRTLSVLNSFFLTPQVLFLDILLNFIEIVYEYKYSHSECDFLMEWRLIAVVMIVFDLAACTNYPVLW